LPLGRNEKLIFVDASRTVVVQHRLKLALDGLEADGQRRFGRSKQAPEQCGLEQMISKIGMVFAEKDGSL
jgi:hypothetical protein